MGVTTDETARNEEMARLALIEAEEARRKRGEIIGNWIVLGIGLLIAAGIVSILVAGGVW